MSLPCGRAEELLRQARALLGNRVRWTSGTHARDPFGRAVLATSPVAASFDAIGALLHVSAAPDDEKAARCARSLLGGAARDWVRIGWGPARVNDERGYEAVLAMYDRAIGRAARCATEDLVLSEAIGAL